MNFVESILLPFDDVAFVVLDSDLGCIADFVVDFKLASSVAVVAGTSISVRTENSSRLFAGSVV